MKTTRNSYYYTVWRAKCMCWKDFLQGAEEVQETAAVEADTRIKMDLKDRQMGDSDSC